jgi:hypothetical protein
MESSGSEVSEECSGITGEVGGVWTEEVDDRTEFIETWSGSCAKTGRSNLATPGKRGFRRGFGIGVEDGVKYLVRFLSFLFGASLPGENSAVLLDILDRSNGQTVGKTRR